jgi:hypothetical protein
MSVVMIGDWGRSKEGIYTHSINATTKDDIYNLIKQLRDSGAKFWETPNITHKFKTYHVLLKWYVPKEMGYPDESSFD